MERELICLSCPNGCHLTVTQDGNDLSVEGAQCDRGEDYAREEIFDPKRIVTAVVRTNSDAIPYISIKTDKPMPKPMINGLLRELYQQQIALPVKMGDILLQDFQATGVNVVFTRSAAALEP